MNERCPLIFGETWRPITKLSVPKVKENMYFVSDRGRVISRSIHRKEERILSLVETNNGYFRVGLRHFVLRLSDEDLHKLFKYFQDHKNINYKYKSELYRNALMELFGIEMKQSMTATLSRLHNRVTRTDISSQYDF